MKVMVRSCPSCGKDVTDGPWNKVYCTERCRRRADKIRYGYRKRSQLAAEGLTSRGNQATRDAHLKSLSDSDRQMTAVINGQRVTDNDLGAYRRTVKSDPCAYCGSKSDTVDHIVPKSAVRDNGWTNMTASCGACNRSKSNAKLLSFLLRRDALAEARYWKDQAAALMISH